MTKTVNFPCKQLTLCEVHNSSDEFVQFNMKLAAKHGQQMAQMVDVYSQYCPQALSMKRFIDFGKLKKVTGQKLGKQQLVSRLK